MPLSTFITSRTGFEPVFYARVEGLPYYFYANRRPSWSPPSPQAWRRGLLLPSVTTSLSLDIVTGLPRASGMDLSFVDDPDGFFRTLFAPGRLNGETATRATYVSGAGVNRTNTTIPVADASQLSGLTTPFDAYVGNETMRITAVNVGPNTLTATRGQYFSVGAGTFAYDHVPSSASGFQPLVVATSATVPVVYTWIGRTVSVYVNYYDPDAAVYGAESQSVLVYAGKIRSLAYDPDAGEVWKLGTTHILDMIHREVCGRLGKTQLRGITFASTERPYINPYILGDDVFYSGGFSSLTYFAGGVYDDWEALRADIQTGIDTLSWPVDQTINRMWLQDGYLYAPGGGAANSRTDKTCAVYTRSTTGTLDHHLAGPGFDYSLASYFGYEWPFSAFGYEENGRRIIELGFPAAEFVFGKLAVGDFIPVASTDGFVAPDEQGSVGAWVLLDDLIYIVDQVDATNRRLRVFGVPAQKFAKLPSEYASVNLWTRRRAPGNSPIVVKQFLCSGFGANSTVSIAKLLTRLLLSTGTNGYNHATHDRYARGIGLGIPSALVASNFRDVVEQATPIAARRLFVEKPTKYSDMLRPEMGLFGWGLTWRVSDGTIAAVALHQIVAPSGAREINVSQRAPGRASSEQTTGTVVNQVKLLFDKDARGEYTTTVTINDTVSQDAFGEVRSLSMETLGLISEDQGPGWMGVLGEILVDKVARFNRPVAVARFSVSRYQYDLYPGQIVRITDAAFPNPATGAQGVTRMPARIVSTRFDWQKMEGEVEAVFDPGIQTRRGNIAPTARITARTAGAPNDTLTLSVNEFSASPDTDTSLFDVSDAIRIVETDPTAPGAPQEWTRTVLTRNTTTNQITVATLTGYDATRTYYVEFGIWSAAVSDQRDDFAFLGDSSDNLIENSGSTYYWV